jgi:hypothetical protein
MHEQRRAIISVVWAALAAAVLAVVEDAWASVPVAQARFCDAPNPQHSVANLAPSFFAASRRGEHGSHASHEGAAVQAHGWRS